MSASREQVADLERMGQELTYLLLGEVAAWQERTSGSRKQVRVSDGSPLAVLDGLTAPFQSSHLALMNMGAAADHLNALKLIVRDCNTLPLWAGYPLMRAALECHSTALYILGPRTRPDQVLHRLQLEAANQRYEDKAARLVLPFTTETALEPNRLAARLTALRLGHGISEQDLERGGVGYAAIVRYAAEQTGADGDRMAFYWSLLSGLSHGQQWSGLAALDRREIVEEARAALKLKTDPTVAHVQTTSSWALFGALLAETMTIGTACWERWRQLSRR